MALLQQYWWFVVSLLGAILVFLLFVQGGNSLLFCLGKTEEQRRMLVLSTGRKWEFTFTTLVTFGGAFFASFPLFYSTSFGGAYWLWMIILFSFELRIPAEGGQSAGQEYVSCLSGIKRRGWACLAGRSGSHVFHGFGLLCGQGKHDGDDDARH